MLTSEDYEKLIQDHKRDIYRLSNSIEDNKFMKFGLYLSKLFHFMFKNTPKWEYGTCNNRIARREINKKNVQFVLWNKGEMGNTEDYWCNFDSSWWPDFRLSNNQTEFEAFSDEYC